MDEASGLSSANQILDLLSDTNHSVKNEILRALNLTDADFVEAQWAVENALRRLQTKRQIVPKL